MRHLPWLLMLTAIVGMAGCSDDKSANPQDEPSVFEPRTSPENLLYNLKMAYQERDVDGLMATMAEDFLFYFSEDDQQQFPDPYTREEERTTHTVMFGPLYVQELELDFQMGELAVDPERTTEGDTTWTAYVTQVDLWLFGSCPWFPNDEPQAWFIVDGISKFWFKKTQALDPGTGDPIWEITEWHEIDNKDGGLRGSKAPVVADATWGKIKTLFHYEP